MDLGYAAIVTAVATQGRFGNGMGVEFAEQYWIEYSRDNGSTWNKWTDRSGDYVSLIFFLGFCVFNLECNHIPFTSLEVDSA